MTKIHPNILSNMRCRWKMENKRDCPLSDEQIEEIYHSNNLTLDSGSEEDDQNQKEMTELVNELKL